MSVETLVALAVAMLGSSVMVALLNWAKDRHFAKAQTENLTTLSLREALEAVRGELTVVRKDLYDTRLKLDAALVEIRGYRSTLNALGFDLSRKDDGK